MYKQAYLSFKSHIGWKIKFNLSRQRWACISNTILTLLPDHAYFQQLSHFALPICRDFVYHRYDNSQIPNSVSLTVIRGPFQVDCNWLQLIANRQMIDIKRRWRGFQLKLTFIPCLQLTELKNIRLKGILTLVMYSRNFFVNFRTFFYL